MSTNEETLYNDSEGTMPDNMMPPMPEEPATMVGGKSSDNQTWKRVAVGGVSAIALGVGGAFAFTSDAMPWSKSDVKHAKDEIDDEDDNDNGGDDDDNIAVMSNTEADDDEPADDLVTDRDSKPAVDITADPTNVNDGVTNPEVDDTPPEIDDPNEPQPVDDGQPVTTANNIAGIDVMAFDSDVEFVDAYMVARYELGPGGVFVWNNEFYTTYTPEEWDALSPEERAEFEAKLQNATADDFNEIVPENNFNGNEGNEGFEFNNNGNEGNEGNEGFEANNNGNEGNEGNEGNDVPRTEPIVIDDDPMYMDMPDDMTFAQAFAGARDAMGPGAVFEWRGNIYSTYYEGEWNSMTAAEHREFQEMANEIYHSENDTPMTTPMNAQGGVYDAPDGETFAQAFAEAREALGPGGMFEWRGGLYNTYYQNEWRSMSQAEQQQFNDMARNQINNTNMVNHNNEANLFTQNGNTDGRLDMAQGVSDDQSFAEAFRTARAEVGPGGAFEWRGGLYNTYTQNEWNSMSHSQQQQYEAMARNEIQNQGLNNYSNDDDMMAQMRQDGRVVGLPDEQYDTTETNNEAVEQLGTMEWDYEGRPATWAQLEVGGQNVWVVDTDQDGSFDLMGRDENENGVVDEGEMIDIGEQRFSVDEMYGQGGVDDVEQGLNNGESAQLDLADDNMTPDDFA